jgi:hypothetical protein
MTAEKRSIVTVQVDLEGNILEVGSDVFQATEDGKKLTDEQVRSDRLAALQVVDEYFALSRSGRHSLVAATEDTTPIIRPSTNEGLDKINDQELLIVRTMERCRAENEDEQKLTEDTEINLPNQELSDIVSNAAEFYDTHGTFEGFFEDHPEHQTEDAKHIRELRDSGAPITRAKAYAICIRNAEPYEESKHTQELAGKLIDYVGFDIDIHLIFPPASTSSIQRPQWTSPVSGSCHYLRFIFKSTPARQNWASDLLYNNQSEESIGP